MSLRRFLSPFLLIALAAACAPALRAQTAERELEQLSRALRETRLASDYARLRAFATAHNKDEFGPRAALALGYHDVSRKQYKEAGAWLDRAERDPVLREYALYWNAQRLRATGQNKEALARLAAFGREFPASAIREDALQAQAETAVALNQGSSALEFLSGIRDVESKPGPLLARARANERAGQLEAAAADYIKLYYGAPLSDQAADAGKKLEGLRGKLGKRFPAISEDERMARANAFYDARRWKDARSAYEALTRQLTGANRERAQLRLVQIRNRQRAVKPSAFTAVKITDGDVEAERLYELSQVYRSRREVPQMLETVEKVATAYSRSSWNEETLYAAGNYYWVALDRDAAARYYRRVLAAFPTGRNAPAAHWRATWTDYLARKPEAVAQMEEHLRRFPGSPFITSASYWLGRAAERSGNTAHARSFYLKLLDRYPETYFGMQAGARMAQIGDGPTNSSEALDALPPKPEAPNLDEPIPAAALDRWNRAHALRAIAFDSSAELELRAAYAETKAPRLLVEAAKSALDAGHTPQAILTARQAYPRLESRRLDEGPEMVWRIVYPLPYQSAITSTAQQVQLDPMIVAGLIRQESLFQPTAVSRVGAIGLMQIMPKTGRQLAKQLKLRYSKGKLTNPDFNLRLGTRYLAGLIGQFGRVEVALAAYNGGDFRAPAWMAEREHEEPAEFVESIPLSETREYVQNVMRNAEVYRRLYGKKQ